MPDVRLERGNAALLDERIERQGDRIGRPVCSPTKMTSPSWLSVQGCFSTVWMVVSFGTLKQSPTLRSSAATLFRTTNSTIARNATMTPMTMIVRRRSGLAAATGTGGSPPGGDGGGASGVPVRSGAPSPSAMVSSVPADSSSPEDSAQPGPRGGPRYAPMSRDGAAMTVPSHAASPGPRRSRRVGAGRRRSGRTARRSGRPTKRRRRRGRHGHRNRTNRRTAGATVRSRRARRSGAPASPPKNSSAPRTWR